MRSERGPLLLAVALAVALAACGTGAPDPSYDPPLLTLRGVLTNDGRLPVGDAKVALVWRRPTSSLLLTEGVAQQVPLRAEFPFRFELALHQLPPAEVMTEGWEGSGAVGTLLVYEDLNGNGALDLLPEGALESQAQDRVLGTPEQLSLLYTERAAPPRGFQLVRSVPQPQPQPGPEPPLQLPPERSVEPLDTEIPIPLTGEPQLAVNLCRGFAAEDGSQSSGVVCGGGPCPSYEVPPGATVSCTEEGRAFTWSQCPPEGTLCARNGCRSGEGVWPQGSPRPTGWPCPP